MMRLRRALQFLLPLAILALGFLAMNRLTAMREEPPERPPQVERPVVETLAAVRTEVPVVIHSRGSVSPRAETRILSEVMGRVVAKSPSLASGAFVHEGETLIEIDDTDYRLALLEAELAVSQAAVKLQQVEADSKLARAEWDRLGREGEPSALTLREPQLAEAKATLAAAEARVVRASRDIDRCTITAPYDGRVRSESTEVGQLLMVGGEIANVYAIDAAEVRLLIPDADLEFLQLPLGAPVAHAGTNGHAPAPTAVTLSVEFAGAEHSWPATIVRTEGELDAATRMVVAVARVADPFGREAGGNAGRPPLAPGMFVDARLTAPPIEGVPIPRSALRGRNIVYVVEEGALASREVEVLHTEHDRVVVGAGVEAGARVVISPLAVAYDGMPVLEQRVDDDRAGEE